MSFLDEDEDEKFWNRVRNFAYDVIVFFVVILVLLPILIFDMIVRIYRKVQEWKISKRSCRK